MDKIIALRISLLLMKSRKRQKDLAAYLGVTDNTISYFVSGKRTPNIEQIIKIAQYFGVSTDYILGLSDAETNNKDVQFICDYTGLNEEAVNSLHKTKEDINDMGKNLDFVDFLLVNGKDVFERAIEYRDTIINIEKSLDEKKIIYGAAINKLDKKKLSSFQEICNELDERTTDLFQARDLLYTNVNLRFSILLHEYASKNYDTIENNLNIIKELGKSLSQKLDVMMLEVTNNGNDNEAE